MASQLPFDSRPAYAGRHGENHPIPADDDRRLAALYRMRILDTPRQPRFDRIVRIMAATLGMPVAAINLVDRDRQWNLAEVGGMRPQSQRSEAFCSYTTLDAPVFVVPDTLEDARFVDNPFTRDGLRFYAGAPLTVPTGERIGAVCIGDSEPRELTPEQAALLQDFARVVVDEMQLRLMLVERQDQVLRLESMRLEAEALARSRSDFIANISHELRTPLNGLLGYAVLLEQSAEDDERRVHARSVRECGERMTRILDDVLDAAKVDEGKFRLDEKPFRIDELLEDCRSQFRVVAEAKGIGFDVDVPSDTPTVRGDPLRLRQVLDNLVSNAMKFTASGSVALSAEAGIADGRATLAFSVRDTGIGMTEEQVARLFGRFEQAEEATAQRYGGSGLGLSIARALVKSMGGKIGVESAMGRGTTFRFCIELPVADRGRPVTDPAPVTATEARRLRILVVDDVPMNRQVLRALLARRGHEIGEACDGLQALDQARAGGWDLILMDVDMPGLDGLQATERIRALGGDRGAVPVVALTGRLYDEDLRQARRAGMDDHLAKPVRLPELVALLQRVASGARLGAD